MTQIINSHHLSLLKIFQANRQLAPNSDWVKHYLGTTKTYYNLKTDTKVKVVKSYLYSQTWVDNDLNDLLLSLSRGDSFEELSSMGLIINHFPKYRATIDSNLLFQLLDNVQGWAETDCLCQMCFTAADVLNRFDSWQDLLIRLNCDSNIHKRRASLVLLTKPTRQSPDSRLLALSLKLIDNLKTEKDILITKAVSWLLRSLTKHHPLATAQYLDQNQDSLPKIALRETRKKLLTGKKN
jgi:3-methyladenine DNA glycosylase AlkD